MAQSCSVGLFTMMTIVQSKKLLSFIVIEGSLRQVYRQQTVWVFVLAGLAGFSIRSYEGFNAPHLSYTSRSN
jgi:predicted thioredoxin/glutaredoxin